MSAARLIRSIAAQARVEVQLTLSRGESLLVTIFIPAALLIFFATARLLPTAQQRIDALVPATLSLAIISTGLVSLGIATAYERHYGVLRRLGLSPLPRSALVSAKMISVLALESTQCLLLGGIAAVFFAWRPHGSPLLVLLILVMGTMAFAGMGLTMAGSLRAEATLAGANGLFLFFLLLGGLYVPLNHLPWILSSVAATLPSAALTACLRAALYSAAVPRGSLFVLLAWGFLTPIVAARTFHWD